MSEIAGKTIALAGDHAGFGLKKEIAKVIESLGAKVRDFGPESDASCDFPDHVGPAAAALSRGDVWRAIFIDGAGYPSGILANKFPGVYAAVANDHLSAKLCREHSNANALCLGGQVIGPLMGRELATIFLTTAFLGGKYAKRVEKVVEAERVQTGQPRGPQPLSVVSLEDVKRALIDRKPLMIGEGSRLTPSVQDILRL
jgi:ribose 5-phosphate isomerase B